MHHYISNSQNSPVDLFAFLRENDGDPAVKVGANLVKLRRALLTEAVRILSRD
jgi:hypothetical protein